MRELFLKISIALMVLSFVGMIAVAQAGQDTVVEVRLPDRAALDRLSEAGFSIDDVRGLVAVVYATQEDLKRLSELGYDYYLAPEQPLPPEAKTPDGYHNYAELTALLQGFATEYPELCRLESLGKSVQGRELWVMLITDNPDELEDEPAFKYISTIHGDEPVGTELCLYLIERLLTDYGSETRITQLVDSTAIWFLPLMNPDGRELNSRRNASGVDLNRAFPIYPTTFTGTLFDGTPLGTTGRQPEVRHVMEWTAANRFVLSANFHTGALLVNYPYDDDGLGSINSPTPDDALMRALALRYAEQNLPMYNNPFFPQGVSNGAAWYAINGGLQDWSYRYAGCIDFTIELNNIKWPSGTALPALWENNEEAMLVYIESVHIGARGLVTDRAIGAPVHAEVYVIGNAQPVFTEPRVGNYHRLLLPGIYELRFSAPGYITYYTPEIEVSEGPATRVDIAITDGDINGDGRIDATDLQLVVNGVLGRPVPYDVDVDGRGLSATDIQAMINRLLLRD